MQLRSYDFRLHPLDGPLILRPLTSKARHWASDHFPKGDRLIGSQRFVPEDRIRETLTQILSDGLTIAPLE